MLKKDQMLTLYNHETALNALEGFINELPNGKKDFYRGIRNFTTYLYDTIMPNRTVKYFLDKTPRYYMIIPFLAEVFPNAKFIFLFRNPLEVLSSILTTWKSDRFIIHEHYVDLYLGPHALSSGYNSLKDRSIAVNYSNLVKSPTAQLQKICSYLEIPFDESMLKNYKNINFSSTYGDTTGIHKFESVSTDSIGKWKQVLNTRYRKWFSKRYIKCLGEETLMNFGFSCSELLQEINSVDQLRGGSFQDAFDHFISNTKRIGNINILKNMIASVIKKERFYPYR